jgi:hypothetical protein
MNMKHPAVGALVCAFLLTAAPAAFAQSAADGYSEPAGTVQQQLGDERDPPAASASGARAATAEDAGPSLPFTGIDIGLIGGAGIVLLAFGFAARRLSDSVT